MEIVDDLSGICDVKFDARRFRDTIEIGNGSVMRA